VFFRGKQIGEHVVHDDRALMFLMKLDDAARARAEAREERKEERAHEILLREMDIAARREERRAAKPVPAMHASAAHEENSAEGDSLPVLNGLGPVLADIPPPRVVEAGALSSCA
jgi:predicted flap endonuclease-1-like 5' DNA nuclease